MKPQQDTQHGGQSPLVLDKTAFLWCRHLRNQRETTISIGGHNRLMPASDRLNIYDRSIMDITLPPDFKEFLKLLNAHFEGSVRARRLVAFGAGRGQRR